MTNFRSETDEKDYILRKIRDGGTIDVTSIHVETIFDFLNLFNKHRAEFEHDDLIIVDEPNENEVNQDYLKVKLSNTGLVFIKNGGYTRLREENEQEINRKKVKFGGKNLRF